MFDYLKLYHDDLLAHCAPGEEPLALLQVMYNVGHEEIGATTDTVSFDPINGLQVDSWERGLDKALGGDSLYAPRGGRAVELKHAVGTMAELMLTGRRLVALKGTLGGEEGTRVAWWCPVEQVATIRLQPRFLQAGRIVVAFADFSAIRLMGGMVLTKRARAFVGAFHALTGR